jgi:hypothetical protein
VSGKIIAEVNQLKVNPVDKNSQKLVVSRFERDLQQVYAHYELDETSQVDLARATEIMT